MTPSKLKTQLKPCRYFLRGQCSFGSTCKLSHSNSSSPPAGVGSNPRSQSNLAGSKKGKEKSPSDAASVVSERYHDGLGNDEGAVQKADPCFFYQEGTCTNGDQCAFYHGDPESSSSKNNHKNSFSETKVCHFHSQGNCKNGSQCRFQHVEKHEQEEPSQSLELLEPTSACSPVSPAWTDNVGKWINQQDDDYGIAAVNEPAPVAPKRKILRHTPTDVIASSQVNASDKHTPVSCPHNSALKLHWSQFADPWANGDIAFCKTHAQGICKNGDLCQYRHSLMVSEYASLFHDTQPLLVTIQKEADSSVEAAMPQVIPHQAAARPSLPAPVQPILSSPAEPVGVSRPSVFDQECSFYRLGKCRNGDKCPYLHTQHPPLEVSDSPTPDSGQGRTSTPSQNQRSTKKPCNYFDRMGYCRKGDYCRYDHVATSGLQLTVETAVDVEESWRDNGNDGEEYGRDNGPEKDTYEDNGGWANGVPNWNEGTEETKIKTDEWSAPQDISGWEDAPDEDTAKKSDWDTKSGHVSNKETGRFYQKGKGTSLKFIQGRNDQKVRPQNYGNAVASYQLADGHENTISVSRDLDTPPMQSDNHDIKEVDTEDKVRNLEDTEELDSNPSKVPLSKDGDGWDENWPKPEDKSNLPTVKIKGPCRAFGQGFCQLENDCPFLHIDPYDGVNTTKHDSPQSEAEKLPQSPSQEQNLSSSSSVAAAEKEPEEPDAIELEPIIFAHPPVSKFTMNSSVSFGSDFIPNSVETLCGSRRLRLSNLSPGITAEEIQTLVHPYDGTPRDDTLFSSQYATSIQIDFPDAEKASHACECLHRREYSPGGRAIVASLNAIAESRFRIPDEKSTLKVSWPKASLIGWAHFPSVGEAKAEANRLSGIVIKGRTVVIEICTPTKRQRGNFAIKFSNLPPDVKKEDIEELCVGHTLVTLLDGPTYNGNPVEKIKEEFRFFGDYDFDKLAENVQGPTSTAFITFPTETITLEALAKFGSHKLEFLGDQSLEIKQVYFSRYRVSRRVFDVVRNEIDRLVERGDKIYTLHYNEIFEYFDIRLNASPSRYATFVDANTELCTLLQGGVVRSDAGILWDDYFATSSSVKALQQLKVDGVIPDERLRCIRVFGSEAEQAAATASLLKLLSKVRAQCHELSVPRHSMRPLISGQFETFQREIGVNKVSFDIVRLRIIVKGTNEDLSKVQGLLDSLDSPAAIYKKGHCEICHHEPHEQILLSCRHAYCTPCLQMVVRSASHGPLRCIARLDGEDEPEVKKQCPAYVPYVVVHNIVPPAEEDHFLRSSFLAFVRESTEYFMCPSIDCQTVYQTGQQGLNYFCPRCSTEICSFCKTLAHIGLSCTSMLKK